MSIGSSFAIGNKIRVSPRKINLLAEAIRGLPVDRATSFLKFSRKRVSSDVLKVLSSAIANAENNFNLNVDKLFVKEAYVGKSITLKRFRPRAKGRGVRVKKHFSNIRIVLQEVGANGTKG